MEFSWITLNVKDFEKSLKFYHELMGLEISMRHSGGGMEMAMLGEKDKPKIEIITHGDGKTISCRGISIGLRVESLEKAMEYVKKENIPIVRGPESPGPGISFFFIEDPDGVEVQILEQKTGPGN